VDAEPNTFLALLGEHEREALLALSGPRRFARGQRLMHQGEPGDQVLLLLAGHAKISSLDARGREIVLSFRGPGDVLGELTFSHSRPRTSHVTAIDPVDARAVTASAFRGYLEHHPAAALTLIDVIGARFSDANQKLLQFARLDAFGRIAARLIELSDRYGDRTDTGIEVALPVTQEDLASWAASSRAGTASALRTMRELGWVKTERRRITVLDAQALARRCE
jgi:CRP/FNR family cyclic AMP-dependent transcriptional regulator